VAAEEVFLLLQRKSEAPARLTLLREGTCNLNERLSLSQHLEDDLWLQFDLKPTLLGQFATFLIRPPPLRLSVWSETATGLKRFARGRAARSPLKIGFVASPCLLNSRDVRDLYLGQQLPRASAYAVETDPGSEHLWDRSIRFRVYKIENQLGRCVPSELRPMLELKP
jgi:hypothetical protein